MDYYKDFTDKQPACPITTQLINDQPISSQHCKGDSRDTTCSGIAIRRARISRAVYPHLAAIIGSSLDAGRGTTEGR